MVSATLADPIVTLADVASMLRLSVHSIRHLHRSRKLPGVVIAGKLRFRLSAVERFIADAENEGRQS